MRTLLLSLPLASLILLAGCCGEGCYTSAASPTPSAAVAYAVETEAAPVDFPAGSTITEEQWQAMIAADEGRGAPASREVIMAGKIETREVVKEAPVQKTRTVAPAPATVSMPIVRTEKLPEGWAYMSEVELSGGTLNTVPVDEMYSQAATQSNEG